MCFSLKTYNDDLDCDDAADTHRKYHYGIFKPIVLLSAFDVIREFFINEKHFEYVKPLEDEIAIAYSSDFTTDQQEFLELVFDQKKKELLLKTYGIRESFWPYMREKNIICDIDRVQQIKAGIELVVAIFEKSRISLKSDWDENFRHVH